MKLEYKGMGNIYLSSNPKKVISIDNLTIYIIEKSNIFKGKNGSVGISIYSNACEDFDKDEYYYITFVGDKLNLNGAGFALLLNNATFKEKQKNIFGDVSWEFFGDFDNGFIAEISRIGE